MSPWDAILRWPGPGAVAALRTAAEPGSPLVVGSPSRLIVVDGPGMLDAVARVSAEVRRSDRGGWMMMLGYDVGRDLEPRARHAGAALKTPEWPACVLARIDSGWLIHDASGVSAFGGAAPPAERAAHGWSAGPVCSGMTRAEFERAVGRVISYIQAGDVYQVNLAHRLRAEFGGSARGFFAALARASDPLHGAYLEFDSGGRRYAVGSASPELFLRYDAATRRLTTRPMKGTRPMRSGERELRESEKDRAELSMIVDLMRNDLGRVCELGSVRVDEPRRIEQHGGQETGVLQATATVSGVLRAGLGMRDVLGSTFPPGSVTGAPKIRAMQIIDELEPVARGPYCGAIGFISDSGDAWFNVAIRTALLRGGIGAGAGEITRGTLDYYVGAGIVADSSPGAEWEETLVKAGALLELLGASGIGGGDPAALG